MHASIHTCSGKELIETFSFSSVISHILSVTNQWEQQAADLGVLWFKTCVAECNDYPKLSEFPGPLQSLMVWINLKQLRKLLEKDTY